MEWTDSVASSWLINEHLEQTLHVDFISTADLLQIHNIRKSKATKYICIMQNHKDSEVQA